MTTRPQYAERDEVPLTGILREFRTALREEMHAARRHASSAAVPLVNGRRIAKVGGGYQYVFDIENALNLPGDVPGDLHVPGHAPLEVAVISSEGLAITLSIPMDLGAFVPSARLQSDLVFLMRKLIERIEALADRPNPVGERVRGARPISGEPVDVDGAKLQINREQAGAVGSSLGRDTTFIWGPPGTGKTRTIGAIAEELYRAGRSALLVSHTNIAVDQAVMQIAEALGPDDLAAGKVVRVGDRRDPRVDSYPDVLLKTQVERRETELTGRRDALRAECEAATAQVLALSRTIDICEWAAEAEQDISKMALDLAQLQDLEADLQQARADQSRLAARTQYWATAADAAREVQRKLSAMAIVDGRITQIRERLSLCGQQLTTVTRTLAEAQAIYAETTSVNWLIRRWRRLPHPHKQLEVVEDLQARAKDASIEHASTRAELIRAKAERVGLATEVEAFRHEYGGEPVDVLRQMKAHAAQLAHARSRARDLTRQSGAERRELENLLRVRVTLVRELGLTTEDLGSAETMLRAIRDGYERTAAELEPLDLARLRAEREQLNNRIVGFEAAIRRIEEALKRVEELVIADATVVATTLTRAYLWDAIQARRFDTVILDEASMAPIPALWVAAGLAEANAVVVGDFKQLPPIVLSKHELAQKWLGIDIFEKAGASSLDSAPAFRVDLKWQYRMHPRISAIPNSLVYEDRLKDADQTRSDTDLESWYCHHWGHDEPVLLVDTGSVGAWVTAVPRRGRCSRLNFLSATICVDLAEKLLRDDRTKWKPGDPARILIVCPYQAHARFLALLLREQGLRGEVAAGTVHSFQGLEGDVVVLDLVNDEPHWRVGMFMAANDDSIKPLLNVALTRARRRLIVVGDFEYIAKRAKKAFLGKELIPFLRARYPCVEALDVARARLSARAARAQSAVLDAPVEPHAARIVGTQEDFYPLLHRDLAQARTRVLIFSPFMTQNRLSEVGLHLRAAVERGVRVYIVTKAHSDRTKRDLPAYRMLERRLTRWGVVVVHKRGMHEKLVFIDEEILWSGSLNCLSFTDTQEIMERRVSRTVVEDFGRTLRLADLIAEYDAGPATCPICRGELVASEGGSYPKSQPFFWRCVNKDCGYKRFIDEPPLKGDVIRCHNCGGQVEYGEWGRKPAWRCLENRHHHQKLVRAHLRLPKMRALIPKAELQKLDKRFRVTPSHGQKQLFGSECD